jgi:hypothetical protein
MFLTLQVLGCVLSSGNRNQATRQRGGGSLQHDLSSGKVNGHDVLLDLRTWCSHTPGKGRSQARVPLPQFRFCSPISRRS